MIQQDINIRLGTLCNYLLDSIRIGYYSFPQCKALEHQLKDHSNVRLGKYTVQWRRGDSKSLMHSFYNHLINCFLLHPNTIQLDRDSPS